MGSMAKAKVSQKEWARDGEWGMLGSWSVKMGMKGWR